MGWGDCGTDSKGRPIGYAFPAICDQPECVAQIDRGLSYACGGMHGEDPGCEEYFCETHLGWPDFPDDDDLKKVEALGHIGSGLCKQCCELIVAEEPPTPGPDGEG